MAFAIAAPRTISRISMSSSSCVATSRAKESTCCAAMYPDDGRIKRSAFAIIIDASQDKMDWAADLISDVAVWCWEKWEPILCK